MSNAKRAIMVPVLTLAVCAIAMVGLGFALTTSVTSNSNTVEKMMIDLDNNYSNLHSQEAPDETDVDKLFTMKFKSEKDGATTYYKLQNDITYVKIFSNVSGATATLSVTAKTGSTIGSETNNIVSFDIALYNVNNDGSLGSPIDAVRVSSVDNKISFTGTLGTGVDSVYALKITSITVKAESGNLEYTEISHITTNPVVNTLVLEFTAVKN